MEAIVIEGVPPYNGRYEIDFGREWTTREWSWFKKLAGYLPGNIEDGLREGDPELVCVFAVVALHRAGRIIPRDAHEAYEKLIDVPLGEGAIRIEGDSEPDEDADAGPPPRSSTERSSISGTPSSPNSEMSETTPNGTGDLPSATSASLQARSET